MSEASISKDCPKCPSQICTCDPEDKPGFAGIRSKAHRLLREHIANLSPVQAKVVGQVLEEQDQNAAFVLHLQSENGNLLLDVARLTRRVLDLEESERKRVVELHDRQTRRYVRRTLAPKGKRKR